MRNLKKDQRFFFVISFILSLLLIGTFILTVQVQKEESYFDYTDEDVKMLGDFMYAEMMFACKYCSLENEEPEDVKTAYMLIGSVVLHRLESRYWGETLEQVIYAPGQYVIAYTDVISNLHTPYEVYEWAEELLQYGPEGPEGLIYEMWFNWDDIEPYWELGGIHFYIDKRITKQVEGGKVN